MLRVPSSDDITVAIHECGRDPEGPQVLLAHATGFHGAVWQPLARALVDRACWAPDLRGHGLTATPPDFDFNWEAFADDVLAVVDGLHLHQPLGVGHSKGGAALLLAEARRPGTFRGLWLYEPIVFPPALAQQMNEPASNPLAEGARRRRDSFPSFDEAEANFASKPPMNDFDSAARHAYVRHGFAGQPDGSVELLCRPADEAKVYEMGGRHKMWDRLDKIQCPVVVVRGNLAVAGPAAIAQPIVDQLAGGSLESYDDLGHFGPMQAPLDLARSILRFDGQLAE